MPVEEAELRAEVTRGPASAAELPLLLPGPQDAPALQVRVGAPPSTLASAYLLQPTFCNVRCGSLRPFFFFFSSVGFIEGIGSTGEPQVPGVKAGHQPGGAVVQRVNSGMVSPQPGST